MSRDEPPYTTYEATGGMLAPVTPLKPLRPFAGPPRWIKTIFSAARLRVTEDEVSLSPRWPLAWLCRGVTIPIDEVITQEVEGVLTLRRRGEPEWPMEFYTRRRAEILDHLASAGAEIDTTPDVARYPSRTSWPRVRQWFRGEDPFK